MFLYGGNDYANTLPPYDQPTYNQYQAARRSWRSIVRRSRPPR